MNDYSFTRDLVEGAFNIDNPLRKDGNGRPSHISLEVRRKIPKRRFTLQCTAARATFRFDQELSPVERAILETVVTEHKNNL